MSSLHLVTGGDEPRRRVLVADLVARTPGCRLLTWGGAEHEDARDHAPSALAVLTAGAEELLLAADLPGEVVRDLTAALRDDDLLGLLGAAAVLRTGEADLVVLAPATSDPARLVTLPQRAARLARSFVPLLARWDAVVAPPGVGALARPAAATLEALRTTAALMDLLDDRLCSDAHLHHLPSGGLVEAGRTAELDLALALMGRGLAPVRAADRGAGASPFVLRLPLPGLTAADITLEREDDDLVVTAGRLSRCTRLGALQRRCRVVDASMRAGVLTVELEPDEAVWPR